MDFAKAKRGEHGAYLVELVFALPLFLIIILIFLWLAIQIQASTSFTSAVNNGVRLAVTRGNPSLIGFDPESSDPGLIPAVHANPFWGTEMNDMLCDDVDISACHQYYDNWAQTRFSTTFDQIPTRGIYAIIYISEAVRLSNGGSVRFPCDPEGAGAGDGGGCLSCEVLQSDALGEVAATRTRLIVECRYQPATYPIGPITQLFNLVLSSSQEAQRFVLRRRMFIDTAAFNNQ